MSSFNNGLIIQIIKLPFNDKYCGWRENEIYKQCFK